MTETVLARVEGDPDPGPPPRTGIRGRVLRRLLASVAVVWLAYTLSFLMLYALPGDAVLARIGGEANPADVPAEQIEALRAELGLDRPLPIRYLHGLGGVLTGDLGTSMRNDRPVVDVLGEAVLPTLQLAGTAFVVAVLAGAAIALVAARAREGLLRTVATSLPALGSGLPTFWIGIVAIWVFSFGLGWLPATGGRGLASLVMPALTLAIVPTAVIAQVLTGSLRQALDQPYAAATAPATGAGRWRVLLRHCVPNAVIPTLTIAGVLVGVLLGGSVVVETVFARPGIGRVVLDAVGAVDLPVIQAVVLLSAVLFVLVNLLVDLSYPMLDPRLRRSVR